MKTITRNTTIEEWFTMLVGLLVFIAAGTGVLVPGFYDHVVDPRYATGTIMADLISMVSVLLLAACIIWSRRGSAIARLSWVALLTYIAYAYALYCFDRMFTILYPVYMAIFGISTFLIVSILTRLDIQELAERANGMKLRRCTAIFLILTGAILYVIELPIILSRILSMDIEAGGTPFMVMDMVLVAPIAILTGIWLWQHHPWGAVLSAIFLIKAITIMTSFLIADYIDWFTGRLVSPGATIAFTVVYVLVYFFTWNYFSAFNKKSITKLQTA